MKSDSVVVLLSSGLDSAFNLAKAAQEFKVTALTFNYGQKSALREMESAQKLAAHYGAEWHCIDLLWFKDFTKTSLIASSMVPLGNEISIDDRATSEKTAERVWVPNRNGIFFKYRRRLCRRPWRQVRHSRF